MIILIGVLMFVGRCFSIFVIMCLVLWLVVLLLMVISLMLCLMMVVVSVVLVLCRLDFGGNGYSVLVVINLLVVLMVVSLMLVWMFGFSLMVGCVFVGEVSSRLCRLWVKIWIVLVWVWVCNLVSRLIYMVFDSCMC